MATSSKSIWIRFGILALLGATSFAFFFLSPAREYLVPEQAFELLDKIGDHPAAPIGAILLYIALGVGGAPLTPMILATGAVFGFSMGFVVNYVGVVLSAAVSYGVGRYLGYDFVRQFFGNKLAKIDAFMEDRSFWPVVRIRYVPVPFPVTNYGSALLGVPFPVFLAATATAYIPIMLVWTYFSAALMQAAEGERSALVWKITIAVLAMAALTFLPGAIAKWRRRRLSGEAGSNQGPA